MSDPFRYIQIDKRMEVYEGYVPDDWGPTIFGPVKDGSALDRLLLDLLMAWRTTAYIAQMPATAIKLAHAMTLGYAKFVSPDASIVGLVDGVLVKLSQKVPELVDDRKLRTRLAAAIAVVADDFRAQKSAIDPQMPIEPLWKDLVKEKALELSIWSSQRIAYVSFYNAYEAFLVDCAKVATGAEQLRSTDKNFKRALRTAFDKDISVSCWTHHEINNARLVRHALSHAAGRETTDLKKQTHGIYLTEGVLQILPGDNHNLLRRLRVGVDALVAVAFSDPKFA